MALSYKARKRLSLLILLVGMPAYVVLAVTVLNWLPRLPLWAEVPVYVVLGLAWILPFKAVFKGIGQVDPDLPPEK
jgi:L-asparagine transporter-like permease